MAASSKSRNSTEPFDRRPQESARAYEAFRLYIEMGPNRSLPAVGAKLGKSVALMERWSSRWKWRWRARSYDDSMQRQEEAAKAAALKGKMVDWAKRQERIKERDWEQGEALREKVEAILKFPLSKVVTKKDGKEIHIYPVKFSVQMAARMLEVASERQRLAAGMATEKTEITGAEGGPVAIPAPQPAQVVIYLPENGRDKKDEEKK